MRYKWRKSNAATGRSGCQELLSRQKGDSNRIRITVGGNLIKTNIEMTLRKAGVTAPPVSECKSFDKLKSIVGKEIMLHAAQLWNNQKDKLEAKELPESECKSFEKLKFITMKEIKSTCFYFFLLYGMSCQLPRYLRYMLRIQKRREVLWYVLCAPYKRHERYREKEEFVSNKYRSNWYLSKLLGVKERLQ